jgi:hypothetical protein
MQTPHEGRGPVGAAFRLGRIGPALARLLADHRYEDALILLRAARRDRPDSRAIAEGIALLEERLFRTEVRALGDLSRRPRLACGAAVLAHLAPAELSLAIKIDGQLSFGELIERAGPTRFEVVRRLRGLLARGVVALPAPEPTIIVEPPPAPAVPARTPRPIDCERTAQIALVPEAGALLARARGVRARRARRTRWLERAMWACLAVAAVAVLAAAAYSHLYP